MRYIVLWITLLCFWMGGMEALDVESKASRASRLLEWIQEHGGRVHRNVRIEEDDGGSGVRVMAVGAVQAGDDIISVPHKLMMVADAPIRGDGNDKFAAPKAYEKVLRLAMDAVAFPREEERLAVRLAAESMLGDDSWWRPYLDALPQRGEGPINGVFFGEEHMKALRGTYASTVVQETQELTDMFVGRVKQAMVGDWDEDLFRWSFGVVLSRAVLVGVGGGDSGRVKSNVHDRPLLVPGADLLNHGPHATTQWQIDGESETFRVRAGRALLSGKGEILNEYAPLGNAILLARYGFAIPSNPHDSLPFTLSWPTLNDEERMASEAATRASRQQTIFPSMSGRFLSTIRHWLLLNSGQVSPVVTVKAHGSTHPRGHSSSAGPTAMQAATDLFNAARIAALDAEDLSPAGIRRLWQLNHNSSDLPENAAQAVEDAVERSRYLAARQVSKRPGDSKDSSQTDLSWDNETMLALQSMPSPFSDDFRDRHPPIIVPKRAELEAMTSLWSALMLLRDQYPARASKDAATLSQLNEVLGLSRRRKRRERRTNTVGDYDARSSKKLSSQSSSSSSSSNSTKTDPNIQQLVDDPTLRYIVTARLGESRLLEAILVAIRSNVQTLLKSKEQASIILKQARLSSSSSTSKNTLRLDVPGMDSEPRKMLEQPPSITSATVHANGSVD